MAPLPNPRHERFCLALAEGKPAHEAYADAGYRPIDGNCIRLKGNERVQARLAELHAAAQKNSEVTVQSLLNELEAARFQTMTKDQMAAACKVIMGKAQLSGLLIDRQKVELSDRSDGSLEKMSQQEMSAEMLDLSGLYPALMSAEAVAKAQEIYEEFHVQFSAGLRAYVEGLMDGWRRGSRRPVPVSKPQANFRSGTLIEAKANGGRK